MLSDSELRFAFGVGIHVLVAGGLLCATSLIIKYFSPSGIWAWGVACVAIGLSVCISSIVLAWLNVWQEDREWEKLEEARIKLLKKRQSGCVNCKYFYSGLEIHCAVHPLGKDYLDCHDFEGNV